MKISKINEFEIVINVFSYFINFAIIDYKFICKSKVQIREYCLYDLSHIQILFFYL